MTRLERLQMALERPFLVSGRANVRYLCGLSSSNAALVVDDEVARIYTDSRYTEAARRATTIEVVEIARDLYGELGALVSGELSFDPEELTVADFEKLRAGGATLVPTSDSPLASLRAVKDSGELDAIGRAAAVTNAAFTQLASERFLGRSERALAWRVHELFHELGAEGDAFPTIVASGPNGALPHAEPGERKVMGGDLVVVDAGALVDGYCADCTRTYAAGDIAPELERAYAVCLAAQEAGVQALTAGALACEVDAAARDLIEASEFAGYFRHGLGHGVGLEVHEGPQLRAEARDTRLKAGNVVTVEPGIYLEGLGGVRIEDLAVVEAAGARVLTELPKQLQRVG
jgi:Xaa-Pro aminopeptidase